MAISCVLVDITGSLGTANACSSITKPLDGMPVVIKILNTTLEKGADIRHCILVSRFVRIRGPAGNSSVVYYSIRHTRHHTHRYLQAS